MNKIRFVVMVMSGVAISLPAHAGIVTTLPEPDAEGWYEFGDSSYARPSDDTSLSFISSMVYPKWSEMAVPAGAKIRLVGGVVMDVGLPADATLDMSGAKSIFMIHQGAFGDRTIQVPSGCAFRASLGTTIAESGGVLTLSGVKNSCVVTNDIVINGTLITHSSQCPNNQTYTGVVSGNGRFEAYSWGATLTFTGDDFAFTGIPDLNSAYGGSVRIQTARVTGSVSAIWLGQSNSTWYQDNSYCAGRLVYAPANEAAGTTPDELLIGDIQGSTIGHSMNADGKHFRSYGVICVYGGNTIHATKMSSKMNFIGELNLNRSAARSGWGMGNVIVDTINASDCTPILSTNVNFSVGLVPSSGVTFDYTAESNAVNVSTLTLAANISKSALSNCVVKACDVLLLPSKMRGMLGQVQLIDSREGRTYDMSVDFSKDVVCEAGCDGTGYLVQAPATGTIAIRIPTGDGDPVPAKGRYPIFVLDDTRGLLDGWTATVNGSAAGECISFSQKRKYVVVRDKRGFWLDVSKYSGFVLSYR